MTQVQVTDRMTNALTGGESLFNIIAEIAKPINDRIRRIEAAKEEEAEERHHEDEWYAHSHGQISFEL